MITAKQLKESRLKNTDVALEAIEKRILTAEELGEREIHWNIPKSVDEDSIRGELLLVGFQVSQHKGDSQRDGPWNYFVISWE